MNQGIGPNTNAPASVLQSDCILLVGEDPGMLARALDQRFGEVREAHAFRSYLFQRRRSVTTIFCGMGTACLEPLIWEMSLGRGGRRMLVVGTAGAMPKGGCRPGVAYAIRTARAAGSGMDAAGWDQAFAARWPVPGEVPTASAVSTDFYYGFSKMVLASRHPMNRTKLPMMFQAAEEDLVDMEVAAFYGLCEHLMPPEAQYLAIKSPANPAGQGASHLENTPTAVECGLDLAARLLASTAR